MPHTKRRTQRNLCRACAFTDARSGQGIAAEWRHDFFRRLYGEALLLHWLVRLAGAQGGIGSTSRGSSPCVQSDVADTGLNRQNGALFVQLLVLRHADRELPS